MTILTWILPLFRTNPTTRLGLFGFLGGEQLRDRNADNSTGNYAVADCILALTWAQQVSHAC